MLLAHSCPDPSIIWSRVCLFSWLILQLMLSFSLCPKFLALAMQGQLLARGPLSSSLSPCTGVNLRLSQVSAGKKNTGTKSFEATVSRFIGRQRIKSTHSDPQCDARMRSPHSCATLPLKNSEAHRTDDKEFNIMTATVFRTCVRRVSFDCLPNLIDSTKRRATRP